MSNVPYRPPVQSGGYGISTPGTDAAKKSNVWDTINKVIGSQAAGAGITALGSIRATVIKDGSAAGAMLVGAGKKLTVLDISAKGIMAKMGSTTVLVPVDKTNLWTEVARLHPDVAAEVPVAEAPAAPPAPAAKPALVSTSGKVLTSPTVMQRRLAGKILRLENDVLKPVDEKDLLKKITSLR